MNRHQHTVDQKPFRSKADQAREQTLEAQYRTIGIRGVAAAVQQTAGKPEAIYSPDDEQMR